MRFGPLLFGGTFDRTFAHDGVPVLEVLFLLGVALLHVLVFTPGVVGVDFGRFGPSRERDRSQG